MKQKNSRHFATKHGANAIANKTISDALTKRAVEGTIPCAVAFDVARHLDKAPAVIGRTADLMELRLVKCQLGLFGFGAKKKNRKPLSSFNIEIETAIIEGLEDDRLSCKKAWNIAKVLGVRKMQIGAACDAFGIKINRCQLGAF